LRAFIEDLPSDVSNSTENTNWRKNMAITPEDLVRREVHYCVSSLVHTLASSYAYAMDNDSGLPAMIEQAFELSAPVPDYEEAAREAGWAVKRVEDGYGEKAVEFFAWKGGTEGTPEDETGWCDTEAEAWREACEHDGIEPYEREVFEHWIVSDWLADKLQAYGEKVDRDFAGLTIWARTTTGQGIASDWVIEQIAKELNRD
jgi:hypothetical protein